MMNLIKRLLIILIMMVSAGYSIVVYSFECRSYTGKQEPIADAELQPINKTLTAIKEKDLRTLRTLSKGNLLLVRRFTSGETNTRGGNLWLRLKWNQFGKNMEINVFGQRIKDFSDQTNIDTNIPKEEILIGRKTCDNKASCDLLPKGDELENMIYGLLRCNGGGNRIIKFSDGLLFLDMDLISDIPVGVGIFFSKQGSGYKPSSLISFQ